MLPSNAHLDCRCLWTIPTGLGPLCFSIQSSQTLLWEHSRLCQSIVAYFGGDDPSSCPTLWGPHGTLWFPCAGVVSGASCSQAAWSQGSCSGPSTFCSACSAPAQGCSAPGSPVRTDWWAFSNPPWNALGPSCSVCPLVTGRTLRMSPSHFGWRGKRLGGRQPAVEPSVDSLVGPWHLCECSRHFVGHRWLATNGEATVVPCGQSE